ncbi:hypothetical protein WHR41_01231 [Cladosporium halotolerans]|uniref:Uncharacterized protein n=1 Tax=Cladosporium halotolerans TaxID=1052096 RepID=A0AB34L1L2_9PEZI
MADCGFLPLPVVCIQCGTNQNPCHVKVVGPTLGFILGILLAIICWPAAIFCGCCVSEAGKKMLAYPADTSGRISNAIPF